jgi:poly-gamma-glutamate synthesis protein (capsule biosynthesis protein)
MAKEKLTMYAVGDCAPFRDDLASSFTLVSDVFKAGDLVFGQLESVLSTQLELSSCTRMGCSSRPEVAKAMKEAGFDVISFASNHALDYGRTAFKETLKNIRDAGLYLTGAGENEAAAREYPVIDVEGNKVAVLGFGSILPQGFWAEEARPGVNPARGITAYVAVEHDQPGTPCRTYTFPHPDDLKKLTQDIKEAKTKADIVVASFHWGIHFKEAVIADYERYYAHFAIDAGADLILGHHQHILKAIFYGLGNFAMEEVTNMLQDQRMKGQDMSSSKSHKEMTAISEGFKNTTRCFPMDSYMTIVAKWEVKDKKIGKVSFLPAYLPENCIPYIVKPEDSMFREILDYMRRITDNQGLDSGIYKALGDEVVIT